MNFENADSLEARDPYLRQIRALGIGLAAAGVAGFVMEVVGSRDDADDVGENGDDSTASV